MSMEIACRNGELNTGPRTYRKKDTGLNDQERAFFSDYRKEPGAVSIVPPTRRPRPEIMGSTSQSFKPRNTLGNSIGGRSGKAQSSNAQRLHSVATPLVTSKTAGSNVRKPPSDLQIKSPGIEVRNGKRRKLSHAAELEEIYSDELAEGNAIEVSISHEPFAQHTSKASGTGKIFSSTKRHIIPAESLKNSVFQDTEVHNYDERVAQAARSKVNGSNHVDLSYDSADDAPDVWHTEARHSLRSTERPPAKTKTKQSTGTRSGYFDDPRDQTTNDVEDSSFDVQPQESWSRKIIKGLSNLGGQFIDIQGRKRGHQSLSPDALANDTSVRGKYNGSSAVQTAKSTRGSSQSPSKTQRIITNKETNDNYSSECEPSIIPRSKFSHSKRHGSDSSPATSRVNRHGESELAWHVGLAAVISRGRYKEDGLGLVWSEAQKSYLIKQQGLDLSNEDPSLKLQPSKLIKIIRERDGSMIRFEVAKIANNDHRLDIRFKNQKDVWELFQRLAVETSGYKNLEVDSDKIQAMFDQHVNERRPSRQEPINMESLEADDIKLARSNQHRRRAKRNEADIPSLAETLYQQSRQQGHSRLVDRMNNSNDARQGSLSAGNVKDHAALPESTSIERKRPTRRDVTATTRLKSESSGAKSTTILERMQAEARKRNPECESSGAKPTTLEKMQAEARKHNGHLNQPRTREIKVHAYDSNPKNTRSLRSATQPHTKIETEPSQDVDKSEKWGSRWKKPLTYPYSGPKRTTVEWDDLDRLEPDNFFNDNLIGLYLRYLEEKLKIERPNVAKKIYIFNSYFYASLTNNGRGKINYNAVKNWTRNVDLFGYDYIIVPINQMFHWYCAVICNMSALPRTMKTDDEPHQSASEAQVSGIGDEAAASHTNGNAAGAKGKAPRVHEMSSGKDAGVREHETRSSFAEMSLEPKDRAMDSLHQTRVAAEDCMSNQDPIEEAEGLDAEPSNDQSSSQGPVSASQRTKRGKRKSLPPKHKINPACPAIITFDSLEHTHPAEIRALKDYIKAEAEAKRGGMLVDDGSIKGMTAKDIPTQDNFSDCGPIMLRYIERLLEDPQDFVSRCLSRELDIKNDWPEAQTSGMRDNLAILIKQLHEEQVNMLREEAKRQGKYINKKLGQEPPTSSPAASKVGQAVDEHLVVDEPLPVTTKEDEGTALKGNSICRVTAEVSDEAAIPEEKKEQANGINREAEPEPQSPNLDHFAAASRSPSSGARFLQPVRSPEHVPEHSDVDHHQEAVKQSASLPNSRQFDDDESPRPVYIDSRSQSVQDPAYDMNNGVPRTFMSAYEVIEARKKAQVTSPQRQTINRLIAQEDSRIEVEDSQPQVLDPPVGQLPIEESTLFDDAEENTLEDIDPLQDSAFDHPHGPSLLQIPDSGPGQGPGPGPWRDEYRPSQEAPSLSSPRKRKASHSPIPSTPPPPSGNLLRRSHHDDDRNLPAAYDDARDELNDSLNVPSSPENQRRSPIRKGDIQQSQPPAPHEPGQQGQQSSSAKKRGRQKKRKIEDEQQQHKNKKRQLPELIELDSD